MTRRLDLGPILAIAGALVAGIAIIAGFVIVGGPGHARDQRLDDLTNSKIGFILGVVQCAYGASGIAPIDYPSATRTRSAPSPGTPPAVCESVNGWQVKVGTGDAPASPGDITYQETGPTQIKICANYRTAQRPADGAPVYVPLSDVYPAFAEGHPAGVHCYVLDLVKSAPVP